MLIPSIDLQDGRIVQLVQGETLAIETHDFDGWIDRFSSFPKVQLIDLDAAKGSGANAELIGSICARLPCRVGGGIRTPERALELIALNATAVILGSSLFKNGAVDVEFAERIAAAITPERFIAAVDSRGGSVVVDGWRTTLPLSAVDAVRMLEPYAGEFLYTHVDKEGLMQGTDMRAIAAVRDATARRLTAAGGITTMDEVEYLDSIGVDAVVGMAIYSGRMSLPQPGRAK
ncbi:MAG TPA: HisA/HisF-related TIM barrel protein [Vicinamibacterales bacterium]|jgi:phosphoribosylformimino-5-aminoimidazole carboxamide ribotide isomerase